MDQVDTTPSDLLPSVTTEDSSVTELSHGKHETFQIDMHRIQPVQQGPDELHSLGITIYDQDTFEKGVLEQVDEAIERRDRVDSQGCQEDNSGKRNEDCSENAKTTSLECEGRTVFTCEENVFKDDNNFTSNKKSLLFQRLQQGREETEYQKKIRLGEMTPFGSVIDKKDLGQKNGFLSVLNGYFQSQLDLQEKITSGCSSAKRKKKTSSNIQEKHIARNTSQTKSPLKKRILFPPKRKRKEDLGCKISEPGAAVGSPGKLLSEITPLLDSDGECVAENSSDSDYVPDYSDEDKKTRKKKGKTKPSPAKQKKFRKIPEDWATDDSDWESSDDEPRRRKKSSKKEIDDGNVKDYEYRLRCWEASKPEDSSGDHYLSGEYHLPKSYWSKLYK